VSRYDRELRTLIPAIEHTRLIETVLEHQAVGISKKEKDLPRRLGAGTALPYLLLDEIRM